MCLNFSKFIGDIGTVVNHRKVSCQVLKTDMSEMHWINFGIFFTDSF